ncbi:MAG: RNA polymerase sigma factor region1.1 domain-containing protein [Lachnospiraceae bacterium]|nr:RNA polymerase sigma factor region1.1 domain-containing protein [Lachnospiraceae bacterium]
MEQKIIFREMLGEIRKLAEQKGNVLTRQEVNEFFAHAQMTEEQLDMICEYLNEQMIRVEGWNRDQSSQSEYGRLTEAAKAQREAQGTAEDAQNDEMSASEAGDASSGANGRKTGADGKAKEGADGESQDLDSEDEENAGHKRVLEQYVEDVSEILELDAQEEEILFLAAADGDMNARNRLIASFLPLVLDMAGEMETEGVIVEDLIQEGNMGLILSFDTLERGGSLAANKAHVLNEINRAMQEALDQQTKRSQADNNTVKKVNSLHEAVKRMEEDFGVKPSAEELSAYLEMPMEEIMDILGLSGENKVEE